MRKYPWLYCATPSGLAQRLKPPHRISVGMGEGRSLLTDREREILRAGRDAEGHTETRWHNVRHRARERVQELPEDLEVLAEHYPELFERVADAVEQVEEPDPGQGSNAQPADD